METLFTIDFIFTFGTYDGIVYDIGAYDAFILGGHRLVIVLSEIDKILLLRISNLKDPGESLLEFSLLVLNGFFC